MHAVIMPPKSNGRKTAGSDWSSVLFLEIITLL